MEKPVRLSGCLDFKKYWIVHSIIITHHFITVNFLMWHVWHLFSTLITQKNLLFVGLTNWLGAAFISFFISFFSLTPIPKPTEPREKKKPNVKRRKKKKKIIEKPSTDPAWKKRRRRRRQRVLEKAKGLTGFDYSLTVSPSNMCVFTKMSS